MGSCRELVDWSPQHGDFDEILTCGNIMKVLIMILLLLILCFALAGVAEAHWMEIARGFFIIIIICCCIGIILAIMITVLKHKNQKCEKDSSITINNSNKTEEEWSPHRKVSGVEQTTFTVERKLNVEIDMNGDQDSEKQEWVVNYVTEDDNSEKKDDEKENWKK